MSVEIYYFSGTGNSLFVAKELQKRIPNAKLIPIVSLLNESTIKTKGKTIGLIFPVHALTIPIAVKRFIQNADFSFAEYIFAIATREGTIFRGFEKIDQILKKKRKRLNLHFILNMYNNESRHEGYIVPTNVDIDALEKIVLEKLDYIQNIINTKQNYREMDDTYTIDFGKHPIMNYLLEKAVLSGMSLSEYIGGVNYFYSNSKCTGCGICEKVCLSEKIKMIDKKPVWQKNTLCYMCFACLNFCPIQSVQINDIPGVKSYSVTNGRYPHPYATISDLTKQKIKL